MKKLRLSCYAFASILTLLFGASCSGSKQAFYFQNNPATPIMAQKQLASEPVYTASTEIAATNFTAMTPAPAEQKLPAKPMTRKEARKTIKKYLAALQDTTPGDKKVIISTDKEKLEEIKSEVKDLKNSVKVEKAGDDKVVINYKEPRTQLSNTTKILLAVAAVLILAILFSIPVLGGLLAFILGLAVVAAAVALLLGIIEIRQS